MNLAHEASAIIAGLDEAGYISVRGLA